MNVRSTKAIGERLTDATCGIIIEFEGHFDRNVDVINALKKKNKTKTTNFGIQSVYR